jgi:excisionase family DNA binding protein
MGTVRSRKHPILTRMQAAEGTLMEKLSTYAESAKYLGLAIQTLYAWGMKRKIQTLKLGRLVRIKESELIRIAQKNTREVIGD